MGDLILTYPPCKASRCKGVEQKTIPSANDLGHNVERRKHLRKEEPEAQEQEDDLEDRMVIESEFEALHLNDEVEDPGASATAAEDYQREFFVRVTNAQNDNEYNEHNVNWVDDQTLHTGRVSVTIHHSDHFIAGIANPSKQRLYVYDSLQDYSLEVPRSSYQQSTLEALPWKLSTCNARHKSPAATTAEFTH